MDLKSRRQRREGQLREVRRERLIALLIAAAAVGFLIVFFFVVPAMRGPSTAGGPSPAALASQSPQASTSSAASPASSPSAGGMVSSSPSAPMSGEAEGVAPARPKIRQHPIEFSSARRAQMKAYSLRHYGEASVTLAPKVVVLHYTAGGTAQSAWSLFNSNQPNVGEKPGTVAHFIIHKDGTIEQLIPLDLRGRHTIGLNHVAIGIEFVQDAGSGDAWATSQILQRRAQIRSGLALVRWLQYKFHIKTKNVIGHGTANESPFFKDLTGWSNDHVDWSRGAVALFHKRLEKLAEQ